MFFPYFSFSSTIFAYFWTTLALSIALLSPSVQAQNLRNQSIRGTTGGNNNSGDCGYIADKPNHVINLSQQVYSLNVILEAQGGKPSLLILGPGTNDRFCILGEPSQGKNAQMGGVWAPGKYLIYVGDAQGSQNPFTLKIVNNTK